MSDSQPASYYEIALTNRQVLVAFVVLLVCLVASFFSGVWIGRSGVAVAHQASVTQAEPEAAEPRTLEEFSFFSDQQAAAEPAPRAADPAPAPRGGTDTTLAQDLGAVDAPPAEPQRQADAEPAAPQPRPPAQAADRLPVQGAAAPPATAATAAAVPAPADGEIVIQVFSSTDEVQARSILGRLKSGGYAAFLSPVEVNGQLMYRVRIGPFGTEPAARTVADQVRRAYKLDTWITR